MHNEQEEIKKQALKNAESLRKQARDQGSANLFDKAAEYYFNAGRNKDANDCWDAAERLRRGEKADDE